MKKEQSRPVHYFIAIIAVAAGVLFGSVDQIAGTYAS